ncbi:MAG: N-6 DNA methylase [Planctomycetaceae bacterium]|nr:N-6 DNA methylase [Planctomycetaceae bacterium]
MAKKTSNGSTKQSIVRHHSDWIRLVERSGPFLSMPVLLEVFPQGLNKDDRDRRAALRERYESWQSASNDISVHRAWVKYVLTDALELPEEYLFDAGHIPQSLQLDVTQQREVLKPDMAVVECDDASGARTPRMIVMIVPSTQGLDKALPNKQWKASPQSRMSDLVRGCSSSGITIGLLTNGEQWMLVYSKDGETASFTTWYASIWFDEPITLRAFRGLLSARRFFGDPDQTLERLFERSAQDQHEVTDQLGLQIRDALETLVEAIDRIDRDRKQELLKGVSEEQLYEACINVMMRLVFLFFAEERRLLPVQESFYEQNYSILALVDQLQAKKIAGEELLEYGGAAWSRLLALFRAMHGGVRHDDMYLPAYGGSLFDPDRFPFLEGRSSGTTWKDVEANQLPISDRTMLHILEALQFLEVPGISRGERVTRRISFRELGVEDIGHIYESLLDHTAKRAESDMLGLVGSKDKEPEISLALLEEKAEAGLESLVEFLASETGKADTTLENLLNKDASFEESQLLSACNNNNGLLKRIKPFANLIRANRSDDPVVIPKGSVFVTAGTDRRSSGTHYTPRNLTEPIVQYTLEPLVYIGPTEGLPQNEWKLKSPAELLDLKICDMACGSGAFLVQAARYMSDRLLEAWNAVKQENPNAIGVTPEGKTASGKANEILVPNDTDEQYIYALRIIVQRCLYGVDINPLAAEMAKLSLWLLTLAKDQPFEFLDHAIRCGDSLVGISSIEQLQNFSLDPGGPKSVRYRGVIRDEVSQAIDERLKLQDMQVISINDVHTQEDLLRQSDARLRPLVYAADLLVSASLWHESTREREEWTRHFAVVANELFDKEEFVALAATANKERRGQKMFHWPLEFPEVIVRRGGFDAFVGNPPFMGGRMIGRALGIEYYSFLDHVRNFVIGSPDLCAYFLLRAFAILREEGSFGLLATKTISETGTRVVCLDQLIERGGTVYRAHSRLGWPGVAAVFVAVVHMLKGRWRGPSVLDGIIVSSINGGLEEAFVDSTPWKLKSMKGRYGQGQCLMDNGGYQLDAVARQRLIDEDPKSAEIIRPLYNGKDLNTLYLFEPYRWVINFRQMTESEAKAYPSAFRHVTDKVKDYRDGLTGQIHETCYWRFWDYRKKLIEQLEKHERVLASSRHTKYVSFRRVPTDAVYTEATKLYLFFEPWEFATLQSSFHQEWAAWRSATLGETTFAYSTSECLETWPMPDDKRGAIQLCDAIGIAYDTHRESVMAEHHLGLTDLYNRFHDPNHSSSDIQKLRELHVEMDQAVAEAYDWGALILGHDFHETKQGIRFTICESARREVLQRLLRLNHERYAEEINRGLHGKKKLKAAKTDNTKKSQKSSSTAPMLPGMGDDDDEGG